MPIARAAPRSLQIAMQRLLIPPALVGVAVLVLGCGTSEEVTTPTAIQSDAASPRGGSADAGMQSEGNLDPGQGQQTSDASSPHDETGGLDAERPADASSQIPKPDAASPAPDAGRVDASPDAPGSADTGGGTGTISCRKKGDNKTTITFVNKCAQKIWVHGSRIAERQLGSGEHHCYDIGNATEELSSLRWWGNTEPDPGPERHTLAEMTLNTNFNDFDWFNISHVDAHNLPMQIAPVGMPSCRTLTCAKDLLPGCPAEGRYTGGTNRVISCVSPQRDDRNSPVAKYFDESCKDAYSWSGDDQQSMVACAGEDYDVVFCP